MPLRPRVAEQLAQRSASGAQGGWHRGVARVLGGALPAVALVDAPGEQRCFAGRERRHALGVRVDFWTINDPAQARRLLALGADGVMTDDPRAIAPVFQQLGPGPDLSPRPARSA